MSGHHDNVLTQEPHAENIEDFIGVLHEHMKSCEHDGKYVEAEMSKNRIAELKLKDYENKKSELDFNQSHQKHECEEAHKKQYEEFNHQWDEDLLHTQQEDAQALGELEDRHTKELHHNKEELEAKLPLTFKFSAQLLNMQSIQASYAKQKK